MKCFIYLKKITALFICIDNYLKLDLFRPKPLQCLGTTLFFVSFYNLSVFAFCVPRYDIWLIWLEDGSSRYSRIIDYYLIFDMPFLNGIMFLCFKVEDTVPTINLGDLANFREKYFHHLEETRAERKRKKIEQGHAMQHQQYSHSR